MEITFEDFCRACPAAVTPDDSVFNAVSSFFDSRIFLMTGILTTEVFEKIDSELQPDDEHFDRLERLAKLVKNYVCVSAFYVAVPQLDLVLTPTGFGVVSNQNVAPASADRVRNLQVALHKQECKVLDEILNLARRLVDWSRSTYGQVFFQTLFWNADHIRAFGVSQPIRDDLSTYWPEINAADVYLQKKLSPELFRKLLKVESTDSANSMQSILIAMWRNADVAWSKHDGTWLEHQRIMLRFVEDNIDEFPEYSDSQTYKANHFEPYQNRKDDSCFFFG